jgi:hypothetical protein
MKQQIKPNTIFGRLIVVEEVQPYRKPSGQTQRQFKCRCECGNEITTKLFYLNKGQTKSCGCLNLELIKQRPVKHNKSKTKEYKAWLHMKGRCYNPKTIQFKYWGGRGIKVCDRWKNSFENFLEDMGFKPSLSHSLDRINVDGNYEPSNCRWATPEVQSRNRRCLM